MGVEDEIAALKRQKAILDECVEFLMSRADSETLVELNKKMDFWRVVYGQETVTGD